MIALPLILSVVTLIAPLQEAKRESNWPQFRGPRASGIGEGFATVRDWDVASGKNVLWRTALPGLAHSSPVVWEDRIYVTTAVRKEGDAELTVGLYGSVEPVADEGEQLFQVLCLDRTQGTVLWTQTAFEGEPRFPRHPKGSFAASTPATDGEHVLAFFGTEGLFCYGPDGKLHWKRDFGELDAGWYVMQEASWGFSASPVIHEGVAYIQCDVQSPVEKAPDSGASAEGAGGGTDSETVSAPTLPTRSFVAALRLEDGKELWRTLREEVPTFGAPTVDVRAGRKQLVCNGYKHIGGYDLATGKELWRLVGGGDIPVPTPVVGDGLIYITNAHGRMAPMLAIDALAEGTLDLDPAKSKHMRWSDLRRGTYMQTPLVLGEFLYACRDNGVLTCFEASGGEVVYEERLGDGISGFTSSPVAADGKLYFVSEEGVVYVVAEGFEFELLARNELGEECMATPAIAGGVLFYRTRRHLTAIGAK